MLTAQPFPIVYHGWSTQVIQQDNEFYFECYPPELQDFCNDGMFYPSCETALQAACEFIDREIAIQAIFVVVGEWLALGQVNEAEYWNLTNFL
ncbi:MAG TPA: hypothetical protein V6D07_12255 [Trichocoleus sp.]